MRSFANKLETILKLLGQSIARNVSNRKNTDIRMKMYKLQIKHKLQNA